MARGINIRALIIIISLLVLMAEGNNGFGQNKPNAEIVWEQVVFGESQSEIFISVKGLDYIYPTMPTSARIRIDKGVWVTLEANWEGVFRPTLELSGTIDLLTAQSIADFFLEIDEYSWAESKSLYYRKPIINLSHYTSSGIDRVLSNNVVKITSNDVHIHGIVYAARVGEPVNGDSIQYVEYGIGSEIVMVEILDSITSEEQAFDINLSSMLSPGFNTVWFRAKGDAVNEYSEYQTVDIFWLNIGHGMFPSCFASTDTTIYKLPAQPEGGWYSGNATIGRTPYFSPKSAGPGSHIITYNYEVDNSTFSDTLVLCVTENWQSISIVVENPKACPGETSDYSVAYISSFTGNLTWKVIGGEILSESNSGIQILWYDNEYWDNMDRNSRFGMVTCSIPGEYQVIASDSIYIDMGELNTPANPTIFWGDNTNQLLICNDQGAEAANYSWYMFTEEELSNIDPLRSLFGQTSLDETTKPYLKLNAPPELGSMYVVEVSKYSFCTSKGSIINDMAPKSKDFSDNDLQAREDQNIFLYPNPSSGKFSIVLKKEFSVNQISVINAFGKELLLVDGPFTTNQNIQIDLTHFPAGVYFILFKGNRKSIESKRIIINKQ